MGLHLIALAWTDPGLWIAVLKVAVGLGFVIFVHELGHFVVAKLCGVKCEKFYLGFDIAGWKFCKFTRGETEYGIGVLPLGGYVKMLGQEDNPAKLREEIERAKQSRAESPESRAKSPEQQEQGSGLSTQGSGPSVEAAEKALYDPRSYLAQSVPKRMAIISAGVIMNLIFAFVIAAVAFGMGVKRVKCVVGRLIPGAAAWQEGLQVGDEILSIKDRKIERFRDMQEAITLGDDLKEGLPVVLRRPGVSGRLTFTVMPDRRQLVPRIGISSSWTTTLSSKDVPTFPGSAAAESEPRFEPGDKIIQINGEPVATYRQLHAQLASNPDKPLLVTVERVKSRELTVPNKKRGTLDSPLSTLDIKVEPNPMRRLGLVMEMGAIRAVQKGSPAAKAEIQPGDRILKIDYHPRGQGSGVRGQGSGVRGQGPGVRSQGSGVRSQESGVRGQESGVRGQESGVREQGAPIGHEPAENVTADPQPRTAGFQSPGDPMTLPDRLRRLAGRKIRLLVEREGEELDRPIEVTLRRPDWYEMPMEEGNPMTVPALGIAYPVLSRVQAVEQGSPAAKSGLRGGDVIVRAKLIPPDEQTPEERKLEQREVTVEFDDEHPNWPSFFYAFQMLLPGTQVELQWERHEEIHTTTLQPVADHGWFNPDRGFLIQQLTFIQQAETLGEAVKLGAEETIHATLLVYRFLQKLGEQQVSPRALGGPVSIFVVAKHHAEQGTPALLIFLTLLSANLAVINFLPIPLLDGGHMVLLAWEGIRGKPANERVQVALTYIGLVFILTLMAWVLGLDFGLISRGK